MHLTSNFLKSLFSRGRSVKQISRPIQHHRSKYIQIQDHLLNNNYPQANNLINQLDNQVNRQSSQQYARYLHNKIITQFQLRKYGHCLLAARNSLIFFATTEEQSPHFASSITLLQLACVQFLHNRQKQQKTTEMLRYRQKVAKNSLLKIKISYFNAMSYINQGKIEEGLNTLLEIINDHEYIGGSLSEEEKTVIQYYQDITFISIITVRILFIEPAQQTQQDQQFNAIRLVKNYINNKKINLSQLKSSNPFVIYHQYNQYSKLFPQQTQNYTNNVSKLDALIGQKFLQLKNYNQLYAQLEKVTGTIFQPWLKAQKFLDQNQMEAAVGEFENVAQHEDISPEYDVLKYEAIKYAGEILMNQDEEKGEDRLDEAEHFRLDMRIAKGTQHLPYIIVPFDDVLGVQEMDV